MILIFSTLNEFSTDEVCHWLRRLGKPFVRVNGDTDRYRVEFIDHGKDTFVLRDTHQEVTYSSEQFTSVWYRRGGFGAHHISGRIPAAVLAAFPENSQKYFRRNLNEEVTTVVEYLHDLCEQRPHISRRALRDVNKLITLRHARECGFLVPETFLCQDKARIASLLQRHGQLITKAINSCVYFFDAVDRKAYYTKTELLTQDNLDEFVDTFQLSKVQRRVHKLFELRIFYLRGEMYPMAIYSQSDTTTSVDYRNYNFERPNRNVPFALSQEEQDKVSRFMQRTGLNSGSLDVIYSDTQEMIFLEVNPVGQFSMVSYPCNYHLERRVAQIL